MDKNLLAIEVAQLENQVLAFEQAITKNQKLIDSTNFNYYSGQVAVIIGLLGMILLFNLWWVWLFLLVIGVLTYFSAKSKRTDATNKIEELHGKITDLKKQAIELRAQILAHP